MDKKLVVYKLRKVLRKLYEGYPTHSYFGYIEKDLEFKEAIRVLEEDGIIKNTGKFQGKDFYRLTSEGLKLVEQWNMERLTNVTIILSLIILLLTINQIIFQILR